MGNSDKDLIDVESIEDPQVLKEIIKKAERKMLSVAKKQKATKLREIFSLMQDADIDIDELTEAYKKHVTVSRYKYQHPTTGQGWTGKGQQPKWLKEWLASGHTLEEILVQIDS